MVAAFPATLSFFNLNQQRIHELQAKDQWETVNRLHAAGAQAVSFCANTPHKVYVLDQIEELRQRGAQGIVLLGCTEFPLMIKPADVTLPVFDTTLLHSQMAVDFILGKPGLAHVQGTQVTQTLPILPGRAQTSFQISELVSGARHTGAG
jgi:aspartate/glutamate racemase